jgi:hypothetical protein
MERRSIAERRALVEEWQASGESIRAFCARKRLSFDSFKRWKRADFRDEETPAVFLPVAVKAYASCKSISAACTIWVGDRVTIECDETTNLKALELAIRAAVAACGPISIR